MIFFKAVILDLDGVITQTAKVHAAAWKRLFDEYRDNRIARGIPGYDAFDPGEDYLEYVDGKPRQDGVKSFLQSRGIDLPLGSAEDSAEVETCHGLGNRKDGYFKTLLEERGAEVFEDAVRAIRHWRELGLRTAVASSSKNCERILRKAGLLGLFDVRVDGTHLQEWRMPGKPAPDLFLAAARQLGIDPSEAMLFEDAIAGVIAGRRGGFGLVVGVARHGRESALREAGADIIVARLTDVPDEIVGKVA